MPYNTFVSDRATLTEIDPFPEGFGATVHFSWPGRPFQLLGGLSNLKPSAIFKLGGSHHLPAASAVVASLGISIEPVAAVESQVAALPKHNTTSVSTAIATQPPTTAVLTTRIVRNLYARPLVILNSYSDVLCRYNFLTGYAVNATQINASEQFVPLRVRINPGWVYNILTLVRHSKSGTASSRINCNWIHPSWRQIETSHASFDTSMRYHV